MSQGKIQGDAEDFAAAIEASGFQELPVNARHAAAVAKLPLHHADPFERLLLAQAFTEPLRLITTDQTLIAYGGADLSPPAAARNSQDHSCICNRLPVRFSGRCGTAGVSLYCGLSY